MTASQRRKGHDFERLIARKLRELGLDVSRGQQSWMRETPEPQADLEVGPPLESFWFELKTGARPSVFAAMKQARRDAPAGRTPCAVIHRDRQETLVVLDLEDALELVREELDRISS